MYDVDAMIVTSQRGKVNQVEPHGVLVILRQIVRAVKINCPFRRSPILADTGEPTFQPFLSIALTPTSRLLSFSFVSLLFPSSRLPLVGLSVYSLIRAR